MMKGVTVIVGELQKNKRRSGDRGIYTGVCINFLCLVSLCIGFSM